MSNKNEPITLDEMLSCTALKSIVVQSIVQSLVAKPGASIESMADEILKKEGMQAYIMRLSSQMKKVVRDRTKDEPLPWD